MLLSPTTLHPMPPKAPRCAVGGSLEHSQRRVPAAVIMRWFSFVFGERALCKRKDRGFSRICALSIDSAINEPSPAVGSILVALTLST